MFSNLRQGDTIYVLEQSDRLQLKEGQIIKSDPNYTGSLDIKIKVDDNEYELKQLPYNQNTAQNGSIMVSELKENLLSEVRKLKADSEAKLNNVDYYKQTIQDCETILRQHDASYEKERKRDEEIVRLREQNEQLQNQILTMSQSLTNIEKLLSDKKSE